MQTLGDTTPEIMNDDLRLVEEIIQANASKTEMFWIVVAYKRHALKNFLRPGQARLLGPAATQQQVLKRHVRAYAKKPEPLQGTIVYEYDPKKCAITDTIVNLPDVPVDHAAIERQVGSETCDVAVKGNAPSGSYLYT